MAFLSPSLPFLRISKSEFLIQDFISRIIVNENGISIHQNLSLGVDDQKQIKFWKLKFSLLFKGSLNTSRFFFDSPGGRMLCSSGESRSQNFTPNNSWALPFKHSVYFATTSTAINQHFCKAASFPFSFRYSKWAI